MMDTVEQWFLTFLLHGPLNYQIVLQVDPLILEKSFKSVKKKTLFL